MRLLEFENVMIELKAIKSIEKKQGWDAKEERVMFSIIINNPNRSALDSFQPHYEFKYATEHYRDRLHQELRDKLEEAEVEFL